MRSRQAEHLIIRFHCFQRGNEKSAKAKPVDQNDAATAAVLTSLLPPFLFLHKTQRRAALSQTILLSLPFQAVRGTRLPGNLLSFEPLLSPRLFSRHNRNSGEVCWA